MKMMLSAARGRDAATRHDAHPRHRDATRIGRCVRRPRRSGAEGYRRALAIDPGNGDANYNYGVLLAVTGRTSDARRFLDAACSARIAAACRLLPDLAKPR